MRKAASRIKGLDDPQTFSKPNLLDTKPVGVAQQSGSDAGGSGCVMKEEDVMISFP